MAARENVRQVSQSDNSKPELIVPRYGVVTLVGYGVEVRIDRGHLMLADGMGPHRRYARLPRVGHGLRRLVVVGCDGMVSLAALRWLSDQDAAFAMLERDGKVLLVTGPGHPSDARLRRAQALAVSSGVAVQIARELISQKLIGQEKVARHKLLDSATAEAIAQCRAELPAANHIATIRLIEAQAAAAYWSAWRTLPINFPKSDLPRTPQHWLEFGARLSPLTGSPRLATSPANSLLNYLYAILEAEARLGAAAMGLDPGIGLLHVDARHRDSLACDLMEPIRPQIDAYVVDWITQQPLKREWFFEQRDGNCRLMASLCAKLSETAPTWARAVAPIVEWTAQLLWNSVRKPPSERQVLPTHLTQQHRTEGRGKEFAVKSATAPRPVPICLGCGVTTRGGRHCVKCGKEVSGQKLIELAKRGRMVTLGDAAQKKRAETQRKQQAAKREWQRSRHGFRPDLTKYENEIQPRLASVTISKIATTLGISEPYAAAIRAGGRRPHPRHWTALAKMTSVSQSARHGKQRGANQIAN